MGQTCGFFSLLLVSSCLSHRLSAFLKGPASKKVKSLYEASLFNFFLVVNGFLVTTDFHLDFGFKVEILPTVYISVGLL